jgi:hypothetical protein
VSAGSLALAVVLVHSGRAVRAGDLMAIEVVSRETSNLIYELECVSGATLNCSSDSYTKLWEREIVRDEGDRAALATVREIYQSQGARSVPATTPADDRPRPADKNLRLAGLLARSLDDYAARVSKVVPGPEAARLMAVVNRFAPRFGAVWRREAKSRAEPFARELKRELGRPALKRLLQQITRFYDVDPNLAKPLAMVVLYRPADEGATHGAQVDRALRFEVRPGERAAERLDVAVHELCHYAFSVSRASTLRTFEARFKAQAPQFGRGARRLFDEAAATALGNGLAARLLDAAELERRLKEPNGLYAQSDVDRAAKALVPWIETELGNGLSISRPAFIDEYSAVLSRAFGPELGAPRLALLKSYMFFDGAVGAGLEPEVQKLFRPNYLMMQSGSIDDPESREWLSTPHAGAGLMLIAPSSLAAMVKLGFLDADEQRRLAEPLASNEGEGRAWLLLSKQRDGEPLFVIVARDSEGARHALERLAALNSHPVGLVL